MFNIERLNELKSRLTRGQKLDKIWLFYMDHFADHLDFIQIGKPTHHPLVEKVVPMLSKQIVGETPKDLFLILISDYQFIHGGFTVGKRIGGVIYFEETLTGLIAISGTPPSNMVKYSRFTGKPIR